MSSGNISELPEQHRTYKILSLVNTMSFQSHSRGSHPQTAEIMCLYFFEQITECEISEQLGISTPSVSQPLFGKSPGGKKLAGRF